MVIEQLQQWFDIPYLIWTRDVEVVSRGMANAEEFVMLRLYTDNNVYSITAKVGATSYLGCVASARKPRAGEDWTRGNDLPDGKFCEETFNAILAGIIGYETVKVQRHAPHEPGKEPQRARDGDEPSEKVQQSRCAATGPYDGVCGTSATIRDVQSSGTGYSRSVNVRA